MPIWAMPHVKGTQMGEQSIIMKQVGIAAEGIVNWYNYIHNICTM